MHYLSGGASQNKCVGQIWSICAHLYKINLNFRKAIDEILTNLKEQNANFTVYGLVELTFKNILTKYIKAGFAEIKNSNEDIVEWIQSKLLQIFQSDESLYITSEFELFITTVKVKKRK